jgi:hypothetical protein
LFRTLALKLTDYTGENRPIAEKQEENLPMAEKKSLKEILMRLPEQYFYNVFSKKQVKNSNYFSL